MKDFRKVTFSGIKNNSWPFPLNLHEYNRPDIKWVPSWQLTWLLWAIRPLGVLGTIISRRPPILGPNLRYLGAVTQIRGNLA